MIRSLAAALTLAALVASPAMAAPTHVPLDGEITVGGIGVGCTGIGQTKLQPKWGAYPVRVEFANARRDYLAGEQVSVSAGGRQVLSITCEGPWVLLKLPAGRTYNVEARLTDQATAPHSTKVTAPKHGQGRFVIEFPDAQ